MELPENRYLAQELKLTRLAYEVAKTRCEIERMTHKVLPDLLYEWETMQQEVFDSRVQDPKPSVRV